MFTKFKTKVISLKNQDDRRSNIKKSLEEKNIKFSFFDAINPNENKEKDFIISKETLISRPLTNGEVGCTLSHLKCYSLLIEDDETENYLILEDDADISRLDIDFIEEAIDKKLFNSDVIILGYSKLSKSKEKQFYRFEPLKTTNKFNEIRIGYVWKNWTCGTVAYLINKNGAKKILNERHSNEKFIVNTVADDWNSFKNKSNLIIKHIRPLIVFEDFLNFNSSIEKDRYSLLKKERDFLKVLRLLRGYIRSIILKIK